MKAMKSWLLFAALAVTIVPLAHAEREKFNTDKMLQDLEQQLKLKKDEYDRLKPDLEQAINDKSKELTQSIDDAVDKGFVELDKMTKELDSASKQAQQKLEQALNSEQVRELKAFFEKWDKQAIEATYEELLAELTKLLELSKDQIEKIGPVIKDALQKQAELLGKFAPDTGRKFDQFREEWEALSEDTRGRIKGSLDSGQVEKFDQHLEELRERMKKEVFK